MAVSVQAPFFPKPGMWHLGDSPATYSSDAEGVSGSMAYPYHPPGLESSSMIPTFHHPPRDPEPMSPSMDMKPLSPGKSRAMSSSTKAAKIKRSMSTPNVRGQSNAEAAAMALSADKRRNKLGYHRTSVACGHCRRRKIRCIPAPADPQNRCSNCIRLKKECKFFAVDQQPPPETKRKGSKAQSGTGGASEASSPSTTSGQVPDLPTTVPFTQTLNMPPIQDLGGPQMKRQRTESFSPETKVVTTSRSYDYHHGAPNWMAADVSPGSKGPSDVPQSFWRNTNDSPMTPAFSPFTPTTLSMPHPQNWPAHHAEPSPREDMTWSVPQRSMSYNNLDTLQSQHQYGSFGQNAPHAGENYTTKPRVVHSMYPPPIATLGTTLPPDNGPSSAQDTPQHPQSAGALQPYTSWQQPYPYQKAAVPVAGDNYGSWNTSHGGSLPGPTDAAHSGHQPYQYGDQQGGMYYPAQQHGR